MRVFFGIILMSCAVISFYYSISVVFDKKQKDIIYRLFAALSMASGIWSLGYGIMQFTDDWNTYVIYRAIGLIGIDLAIIFGQIIICALEKKWKEYPGFLVPEIIVEVVVFFVFINENNFRGIQTSRGIITEFTNSKAALAYTVSVSLLALIFIGLSLYLFLQGHSKRNKKMGKALLKLEAFIVAGMFVDTILPAVGINYNIPASAITQFLGLLLFREAVLVNNKNQLNEANIASYVYQSLKIGIYVFDTNNRIVLVNEAGQAILGVSSEEEARNIDPWERFDAVPPANIQDGHLDELLNVEYKGEELEVRLSIDPIFDDYEDFIGYMVVVSNLTEQLKNKELQQNTEMKTQFLANMSHEIRTPLNAILGFNEAILQDIGNKDKVQSYSLSIHEAGENLRGIINSILDISKIEMGQLTVDNKEYSTVSLLDNVSSMFELLAKKKGLDFFVDIDSELPEVLIGDEQHLRQVLINILNNAIKYTDRGYVKFTVTVTEWDEEKHLCKILFSIMDTGRGIHDSDREKLFEKFSRLDTEHFQHTEGTGLGMSIVLFTLKAMGSDIKLDSVYGKGSDFYFELEQVALGGDTVGDFLEKRKELALKEVSLNRFRAPKAKILIVDDVEMNIEATCALLGFTGMQIDKALSGQQAIDMVQEKKYDAIFMDHMMPGIDGIEATEKIRNLSVEKNDVYYASVPIIALTANVMVGMSEVYHQAGMQDFVPKPIEVGAIVAALNKWLPKDIVEDTSNQVMEQDFIDEVEDERWGLLFDGVIGEEAKKYNVDFNGFEKNLQLYEKAYDNNIEEISEFFKNGDVENYVIKIHGLKSTSKIIGAMNLFETARYIEEKGHAGLMEAEDFEIISRLYQDMVLKIRGFLEKGKDANAKTVTIVSGEEYEDLINRIKDAAENFDASAFMALDEELLAIETDEVHKDEIEKLKEMISTLRFSDVSEYFEQ